MRIWKKLLVVVAVAPVLLGAGAISPSAWASTAARAASASTAAKKPVKKPVKKPAKKKPVAQGKAAQTVYEKQVAGLPARFTKQRLDWTPCDAKITDEQARPFWRGAQCALLTAPLDYARLGGKTITIAIDEELAAPGEKSPGILMTNPGGPGGAGLSMPPSLTNLVTAPDALHDTFDIVGMNPRGIGPNNADGLVNSQ